MIRPRKILLIITAIGFWMILFYILVTNKTTQQEVHRKEVHKQLDDLQNRAAVVHEERSHLIVQLGKALEIKTERDKKRKIEEEKKKKLEEDKKQPEEKLRLKEQNKLDEKNNENSSKNKPLEQQVEQQPAQPESRGDQPPAEQKQQVEQQVDSSPLSIYTEVYVDNDRNRPVIPVLVFACNRPSVSQCLDNLTQYRPDKRQFPIIVSQDCGDDLTRSKILEYKDEVTLIEQPDLSDIEVSARDKKFQGYYKISRHYGWALNQVFGRGFEFVIIVEDDLNVSPDFYEYFQATFPLLRNDSSLWCVSAWNDNGKVELIDHSQPELLYRSDFFPGLGWMLSSTLWNELAPKWPKAFWDDWIRTPQQRKDRSCIRPEISRTRTFGKIGVSNGLFFEKHLKYIKLNEEFVQFTKLNMTYLLKDVYDATFVQDVYAKTPVVTFEELRRGLVSSKAAVRIQYNTKDQYKRITKLLGLMDDFRSGVPRTAYHGIVSFFYKGLRVHLAPNVNWKGYDPSWS